VEEFVPRARGSGRPKAGREPKRYSWPLWREPDADPFLTEWRRVSDERRRVMLVARCAVLLRARIGRWWDPVWNVVYTSQPPPWTQAPKMKATRQRLVWWLDRYPFYVLGERGSLFLSQDELAMVSILVGHWPKVDPKKVAAGPEYVLRTEGDSMKKAISEYGYAAHHREALPPPLLPVPHAKVNVMPPILRGLQRSLGHASPIGAPLRVRGRKNAPNTQSQGPRARPTDGH
jgi:hypothetical protein